MPDVSSLPQPQQNIVVSGQTTDRETTKWMLMYDEQLDAFYHDMKHEVKVTDGKTQKWLELTKTAKPFLNDTGTLFVISMLRDPTNKNTLMGNINQGEAYEAARSICHAIEKGLFSNQEEFGMESTSWPFIMEKVRNVIFFALTRPIGGEERNKFHTSRSVSEVYTNRPIEQKSQSGWSLGPFKLGGK